MGINIVHTAHGVLMFKVAFTQLCFQCKTEKLCTVLAFRLHANDENILQTEIFESGDLNEDLENKALKKHIKTNTRMKMASFCHVIELCKLHL